MAGHHLWVAAKCRSAKFPQCEVPTSQPSLPHLRGLSSCPWMRFACGSRHWRVTEAGPAASRSAFDIAHWGVTLTPAGAGRRTSTTSRFDNLTAPGAPRPRTVRTVLHRTVLHVFPHVDHSSQSVCLLGPQRCSRVCFENCPRAGAPRPRRSGADRVFTRRRVFLVKSSEIPSVRSPARTSIGTRTVEEMRPRPHELVAYILWSDPQAGAKRISCCQEPHRANRHDDIGSPDPMVNQCRLCHCLCGSCSSASWPAGYEEMMYADGVSDMIVP